MGLVESLNGKRIYLDTIHFATALDQKATTFLTNDSGFQSMEIVRVVKLVDFL